MCNNPVNLRAINSNYNKAYLTRPSIRINFPKVCFPCGNCLGCRIDNLLLWTARCNYEQIKGSNSFVTFTYDTWHLPKNELGVPTLRFNDLHKYIDNLRHLVKKLPILPSNCRRDFSYFASGEYGELFERPHYHVLFFGLSFQSFKKYFQDTWKLGKNIRVDPLLNGGVRYVVDYFTKEKLTGKLAEENFDNKGLERPFCTCSRGLGSELFYNHREEIRNGQPLKLGSRYIPVPAYYKKLYCRFSDDEILNRLNFQKKELNRLNEKAKHFGYSSVDDYVKASSIALEKELETKFRSQGVGVKGIYFDNTISPDVANNALAL